MQEKDGQFPEDEMFWFLLNKFGWKSFSLLVWEVINKLCWLVVNFHVHKALITNN